MAAQEPSEESSKEEEASRHPMTEEDEHGNLTFGFSYINAASDSDNKAILVEEEGEGWKE